jgi:hypothetical protein
MSANTEASSFADFVDALRLREAPLDNVAPRAPLAPTAIVGLEKCYQDFVRQSAQPIQRRHHVGAMIVHASPEEENSVLDYFVEQLGMRVVDIDVNGLRELSNEDLERRLATLSEPTAHIVALRGLGFDTDPRVLEAIEWSDVDVLLIGYAEAAAPFGSAVRRRFKHRIDVRPDTHNRMWGAR